MAVSTACKESPSPANALIDAAALDASAARDGAPVDSGSGDAAPAADATPSGCAVPGAANQSVSLLLLGNSLMGNIKAKTDTLLVCGGYTPSISVNNPGGYYLYQHDTNATSLALIAQSHDLVLLQEQSGSIGSHVEPYATISSLKTKIEAANGEMGLYQTWAFRDRTLGATEVIISHYETIGAYFNAPVIALGRAWNLFYATYPDVQPFDLFADNVHASTHGQNLISYVLYAYLTNATPVGLPNLGVSDEDAAILQQIAWQTFESYPTPP